MHEYCLSVQRGTPEHSCVHTTDSCTDMNLLIAVMVSEECNESFRTYTPVYISSTADGLLNSC